MLFEIINGGNGGKQAISINYFYIDSYGEFMEIGINAPLPPSSTPAKASRVKLLPEKISVFLKNHLRQKLPKTDFGMGMKVSIPDTHGDHA